MLRRIVLHKDPDSFACDPVRTSGVKAESPAGKLALSRTVPTEGLGELSRAQSYDPPCLTPSSGPFWPFLSRFLPYPLQLSRFLQSAAVRSSLYHYLRALRRSPASATPSLATSRGLSSVGSSRGSVLGSEPIKFCRQSSPVSATLASRLRIGLRSDLELRSAAVLAQLALDGLFPSTCEATSS